MTRALALAALLALASPAAASPPPHRAQPADAPSATAFVLPADGKPHSNGGLTATAAPASADWVVCWVIINKPTVGVVGPYPAIALGGAVDCRYLVTSSGYGQGTAALMTVVRIDSALQQHVTGGPSLSTVRGPETFQWTGLVTQKWFSWWAAGCQVYQPATWMLHDVLTYGWYVAPGAIPVAFAKHGWSNLTYVPCGSLG